MVYLRVPNRGGSIWAMDAVKHEVWIGGLRRPDAFCTQFSTGDNRGYGAATIWFPDGQWDAEMCRENDLVEIVIAPYGVRFRGYITGRDSQNSETLSYGALDLLAKFDSAFFWEHEYCVWDELKGAMRYEWTMRQIAAHAYQLYAGWMAANSPEEMVLAMDLESFPELAPGGETKVMGQPLLQGLQQIMGGLDYRYRIKVDHEADGSVMRAYVLGTGRRVAINRGTDPTRDYMSQPGGAALVEAVRKSVDAKDCVTHVYAVGEERLIETALELSPDWREVPDDFEPPEGDSLKNHVTVSERTEVLQAYEKFTREAIDLKATDKLSAKVRNPNYAKRFEDVGCKWMIPLINDFWYYADDPDNYPQVWGEAARRPKVESTLVQLYDNTEQSSFLVLKRVGDANYYVKRDGFSVKNSTTVELSKPLVDSVSTILAKGTKGGYINLSWNETESTSQYEVEDGDETFDFAAIVTESKIEAGCWLVLGEFPLYYRILSVGTRILNVVGNLIGAGVEKVNQQEGQPTAYEKGRHWVVTSKDPHVATGTGGEGQAEGAYQIDAGGETELLNRYAGMYLMLGNYPATAANEMKVYKIAQDSARAIQTDKVDLNLSGVSEYWKVIQPRFEEKRLYERVWLNAAWRSTQRLTWNSEDLAPQIRNKRGAMKENSQLKWLTERGNFRLIKLDTPGDEDKFTVVYHAEGEDRQCELEELMAWAVNQIRGATAYAVSYAPALALIDLTLQVGDRPIDTQYDTGATVTGITYNLERGSMELAATSWA